MKIKQTSIENKIDINTPDFVYNISKNIQKYNCKFFNIYVTLKNENIIHKGFDKEGVISTHKSMVPDFILLNDQDKAIIENLCNSFNCGQVTDYTLSDYFSSKKDLYFIEAFGDYWHSEQITGIDKKKHEDEVKKAYESLGHHVLILWESDIINCWEQKCKPLIDNFILSFINAGNKVSLNSFSHNNSFCLNDNIIRSMHDIDYRKTLDKNVLYDFSLKLSEFYSTKKKYFNKYDLNYDYFRLLNWSKENRILITRFGKLFSWYLLNESFFNIHDDNEIFLKNIICDKKILFDCFLQMFNKNIEINFFNLIYYMIKKYNFKYNVPFDIAEIIFRIHKLKISNEKIFFDPKCKCGETLVASYLLGFKKYIGFVDNIESKNNLEKLSNFIGYENIDIRIANDNNDNIDIKNCFIFTCCDNLNNFSNLLKFADYNELMIIDSNLSDLSKINDKYTITKYEFWKKDEISDYNFYKINKLDDYNYVRCNCCGISFTSLRGHLKFHHITAKEYKNKFSGSRITSVNESNKIAAVNTNKFHGQEKKYNKRFVYLMPDGSYASKSDKYKRAWNTNEIKKEHIIDASTINYVPDYAKNEVLGQEGEDYVVCRICGFKKGTLTQHLRKEHNLSKNEYIEKYNAPVHCNKNLEAYHNCSLNKWKTQFQNGSYTKKEHHKKEKLKIEKEQIEKLLLDGYNQQELCKYFGCSDVTLRKVMEQYKILLPNKTIISIRKAVKNGAEINLQIMDRDEIKKMILALGKEQVMKKCGVKRTVFDSWMHGKVQEKLKEIPLNLNNNEIIDFFKHYGFPYPDISNYDADKIIKTIKNNKDIIDKNGNIEFGSSAGNNILLTFFPHFFDAYKEGGHSAKWYFENKLEHILNDIKKYSNKYPTISLVRSYLIEHERISGFRPVIAKQIYDKYCNENTIMLDPCGGWGGRLLGAYCSDKIKRYDCLEASLLSYKSLIEVKKYFDNLIKGKQININYGCYEESKFENEFYDLIFTSPPYFCKEHYSDDEMQSCNKYHNYNEWKNGFLYKFIENSYNYLKLNGYFIVNIDDVKIKGIKYKLENDFIEICKKFNFELIQTLWMKQIY